MIRIHFAGRSGKMKRQCILSHSPFYQTKASADAISESIYRGYRCLDTLKNEYAFKPWILRIVRNCAVELVRSNEKLLSIDDVEIEESSGENDIITANTLKKAVEKLKQPY